MSASLDRPYISSIVSPKKETPFAVAATATGVVGGVVGVWTVTPEMLTSDVLGADSAGASFEARTTRARLLTEVSCTLDRADLRSIIADMLAECVWGS
jgi:hypothetical protein